MAKLTSAQIRKIIKAHNIEATVKIPAGLKQAELEKFVESQGFKINHNEKSISKGGKTITLEQAEKVTAPKQKTALQKQKAEEKKQEKAVEQKKKEREIKKEAVKKATKDLVPKTKIPEKVGSKPVPKKEEVKKEEPKKGRKKIEFTGKAQEVQKGILERRKKKELEARKPKRKVLGETKKPGGSAVVQPGKPEGLEIKKTKTVVKNKKPKPEPKAEGKLRKGTKKEAEGLKHFTQSWKRPAGEKSPKNTYDWSKEEIEKIEDIIFERKGIKALGYQQKNQILTFFYTTDGKTTSKYKVKYPKLAKDFEKLKKPQETKDFQKKDREKEVINLAVNYTIEKIIEPLLQTNPSAKEEKELKSRMKILREAKMGKLPTEKSKKELVNAIRSLVEEGKLPDEGKQIANELISRYEGKN